MSGEKISLAVDRACGIFEYGWDGVIAGEIKGVKNTSSSSNWSVITMAAASVVSGAGAIPRGDIYWV